MKIEQNKTDTLLAFFRSLARSTSCFLFLGLLDRTVHFDMGCITLSCIHFSARFLFVSTHPYLPSISLHLLPLLFPTHPLPLPVPPITSYRISLTFSIQVLFTSLSLTLSSLLLSTYSTLVNNCPNTLTSSTSLLLPACHDLRRGPIVPLLVGAISASATAILLSGLSVLGSYLWESGHGGVGRVRGWWIVCDGVSVLGMLGAQVVSLVWLYIVRGRNWLT